MITRLQPDILALQEVDGRAHLGRRERAFEWFTERLGPHICEARTVPRANRDYGHLLWSRWPFHSCEISTLPGKGLEPRMAIEVAIETPGGSITVLAAHLGLSPVARKAQAEFLAARAAASSYPTLMLGDTNAWRLSGSVDDALRTVLPVAATPRSFPAWWPLARMDRIYAGKGWVLERCFAMPTPRKPRTICRWWRISGWACDGRRSAAKGDQSARSVARLKFSVVHVARFDAVCTRHADVDLSVAGAGGANRKLQPLGKSGALGRLQRFQRVGDDPERVAFQQRPALGRQVETFSPAAPDGPGLCDVAFRDQGAHCARDRTRGEPLESGQIDRRSALRIGRLQIAKGRPLRRKQPAGIALRMQASGHLLQQEREIEGGARRLGQLEPDPLAARIRL